MSGNPSARTVSAWRSSTKYPVGCSRRVFSSSSRAASGRRTRRPSSHGRLGRLEAMRSLPPALAAAPLQIGLEGEVRQERRRAGDPDAIAAFSVRCQEHVLHQVLDVRPAGALSIEKRRHESRVTIEQSLAVDRVRRMRVARIGNHWRPTAGKVRNLRRIDEGHARASPQKVNAGPRLSKAPAGFGSRYAGVPAVVSARNAGT